MIVCINVSINVDRILDVSKGHDILSDRFNQYIDYYWLNSCEIDTLDNYLEKWDI